MTNPISYRIAFESFPQTEEPKADKLWDRNWELRKNSKVKASVALPYAITRAFFSFFNIHSKVADKSDSWVLDEY